MRLIARFSPAVIGGFLARMGFTKVKSTDAAWLRHTRMGVQIMSDVTPSDTPETAANEAEPAADPADELAKWKADARKWEARAKENLNKVKELEPAQARLAELEQAGQSELEKAIARAEKAEQAAAKAAELVAQKDREVLVGRIASEKKVPAKYLTGATEEELVASADEFLADIQAIVPDRKPGHVPSAGTGDPKPEVSSLDTGRARAQAHLNKTNS